MFESKPYGAKMKITALSKKSALNFSIYYLKYSYPYLFLVIITSLNNNVKKKQIALKILFVFRKIFVERNYAVSAPSVSVVGYRLIDH